MLAVTATGCIIANNFVSFCWSEDVFLVLGAVMALSVVFELLIQGSKTRIVLILCYGTSRPPGQEASSKRFLELEYQRPKSLRMLHSPTPAHLLFSSETPPGLPGMSAANIVSDQTLHHHHGAVSGGTHHPIHR